MNKAHQDQGENLAKMATMDLKEREAFLAALDTMEHRVKREREALQQMVMVLLALPDPLVSQAYKEKEVSLVFKELWAYQAGTLRDHLERRAGQERSVRRETEVQKGSLSEESLDKMGLLDTLVLPDPLEMSHVIRPLRRDHLGPPAHLDYRGS